MKRWLIAGVLLSCITSVLQAKDLFVVGLSVDSAAEVRTPYDNVDDMFDALTNEGMQKVVPAYTDMSAASAALYVRGLPAEASYAAGSTTLRFRVPSLGIDESFTGTSRDDSKKLFEDYVKHNGNDILTRMLHELARVSPVDPVAGNPSSLMAQMGAQDFSVAMSDAGGNGPGGLGTIGLAFQRYSLGGFDTNVTTLPLGYSFDIGNGYRLQLSTPIYRVDTQDTVSYGGSIGAALRVPLSSAWVLTPALRFGAVGSADQGAAAGMFSGSLTSRYVWSLGGMDLGMTNQVGMYQSRSVNIGDYDADYDLSNRSLKNGFDLNGELGDTFLGKGAHWQTWIIDTRFYGDELYANSWQEYGVAVGTRVQAGQLVYDNLQLGLSYTHGENDVSGVKLNVGYRF